MSLSTNFLSCPIPFDAGPCYRGKYEARQVRGEREGVKKARWTHKMRTLSMARTADNTTNIGICFNRRENQRSKGHSRALRQQTTDILLTQSVSRDLDRESHGADSFPSGRLLRVSMAGHGQSSCLFFCRLCVQLKIILHGHSSHRES